MICLHLANSSVDQAFPPKCVRLAQYRANVKVMTHFCFHFAMETRLKPCPAMPIFIYGGASLTMVQLSRLAKMWPGTQLSMWNGYSYSLSNAEPRNYEHFPHDRFLIEQKTHIHTHTSVDQHQISSGVHSCYGKFRESIYVGSSNPVDFYPKI